MIRFLPLQIRIIIQSVRNKIRNIMNKDVIQIKKMAYDECSPSKMKTDTLDYVRHRAIELIGEQINSNSIEGSIAEAGVLYGDLSRTISRVFLDRKFYLYDTFEGFDERDTTIEKENKYTSNDFFMKSNSFKSKLFSSDEKISIVKKQIVNPERVIIRKGYFPASADSEKNEKFAFVSLDMDLYKPMKSGMEFFFPKLVKGGYLMLHDYNSNEFKGIKVAIKEYENEYGIKLAKVPLPDQGGTLVITKI